MTINEHRHWLAQFQGWIAMGLVAFPCVTYGLGAFLRLCVCPLACVFFILVGVVALWQFGVARLFRKHRAYNVL